jgi:DNA-binding winged helix-turn-helix (wHTH) protein/predicted Ser/Thr protein kinase
VRSVEIAHGKAIVRVGGAYLDTGVVICRSRVNLRDHLAVTPSNHQQAGEEDAVSTKSFRGVRVIRFGDFELDMRAGELRRGTERIRLQEQPYRILTMLLEHPAEVVLREEICKRLWPNGTVVEVSHGINAAVQRLREALGDSAVEPQFVETVARRGYRFLARVETECRRAPSLREQSAGAFADELNPGQTISHFRLEEKLGRGGMGVVYRAEDLNLSRKVALKFLMPETAGDPVAVSRFQREARTASALNHPNICTVYAVEEYAGQPVIVMELVEGRTLESLLASGPIPAAEALPLAMQMAAALDAAQRKGIVHRDLKPGNVMVTAFGVKVLDFGLAKQAVTGLPLSGSGVTEAGAIVGTPNYMAPELFHGKEADARSDLYSFGLMLREMFTDAADLAPVIRRALEPDPENRWQTAGDLKAALECVAAGRAFKETVAPPRSRAREWLRENSGVAVAAVMLVLLAAWFGLNPRSPQARGMLPMPLSAMPASFRGARPAISGRFNVSPDGKWLAYTVGGDVYVRGIDSRDGRVVVSKKGTTGTPFWSPDGRSLAFTNNGLLFTVPVEGGAAVQIGEVNTNIAGAWGRDGTILIGDVHGGLVAIPSGGGPSRKITTPDAANGETRDLLPQFLPGGRRFLFTSGSERSGGGALYAGSLDSGERLRIATIASGATFVARDGSEGYLVFERDGQVMAQRVNAGTLRLDGEAFRVAGPVNGTRAASARDITVAELSVARSALVYRGADLVVLKNWM